jgi:hypothetical protein
LNTKIDVTNSVVGKMTDGGFKLSLNDVEIGTLSYENGAPEYQLTDGFTAEGQRVYKLQGQDPTKVKSYVDNCDQGWC